MAEGNYSLSDIASIMGNKNDGLFGGNGSGFIVLILFLLLMGGNGFWGGAAAAQGSLTRAEVQDGFNFNQLENGINSIKEEICNSTYAINNSIKDGFYANNIVNTNGFNSVNSAIANLGYQMQNSCCELKTAMHAEGEATRQLIQANTIQDLRDKLAEKDNTLQSANLTLANAAQTQNILSALGTYYSNPPYAPTCGCGCSGY